MKNVGGRAFVYGSMLLALAGSAKNAFAQADARSTPSPYALPGTTHRPPATLLPPPTESFETPKDDYQGYTPLTGIKPPSLEQKIDTKPRQLSLEVANPLDSFDANTRAWYSANQLFGKGLDFLGNQGSDKTLAGRIGVSLLANWWAEGMQYVAHEIAHDFSGRMHGQHFPFNFDFGDWGHDFPEYIQEPSPVISAEEHIFNNASGLHQDELNASFAFKKRVLDGRFSFDEAFAHFSPKIRNTTYVLSTGFTERDHPGSYGNLYDLTDRLVELNNSEIHNDIDFYILLLGKTQEVSYTKEDFFKYAVMTDLLSFSTWESAAAAIDYLASGKRIHEVTQLKSGDLNVIPPDFRLFGTPEGFYVDMKLPVNFGNKYLFVNAGTGVDSFGEPGKVNAIRLGAQYHGIEFEEGGVKCKVNPFIYLDFDKDFRQKGHSVGTELVISPAKGFEIFARFEHNHNDMLENIIKREKDGLKIEAGITINY